ncbi:hypothetical protein FRB99_001152 [Tulasnella sp. 403]|nr:hypothetical protein FRB99_001152 [Tulasnella sp. 403]
MDVTSRVLKDAHYNFIAQRAKPSDKTLIPCPHPNAGLSYTHANTLQTDRLYPPVPGRLLSTRPASDARSLFDTSLKTTVIAVGGTLADSVDHSTPGLLTSKQSLALSEVAYGRQEPKHGEISARIEKVSVIAPPNVVGKHGGLGGAQVSMVAREVNSPDIARPTRASNPHPLGSMEYVGYTPDVPDTPAIDSPTWNPIAPVQGRKKAAVDRARDVLQGRLTALKKSAQRK